MLNKKIQIVTTLLFISLISCTTQNVQVNTTDIPTTTARVAEFHFPATQFAHEAEATVEAQKVISIQETQELETQIAIQQTTQTSDAATALSQATEEALPMFNRIEELYAGDILTSTQGTFYQLPDFIANWAMRGNYDFLLTEHTVSDFVVQSTSEWETVGENIDYWNAGCGYVFRLNARGDHYLAFLGSDGRAYLYRVKNYQLELVDHGRYSDTPLVSGSARLLVAVQGERITLFVNDTLILQTEDRWLSMGSLGYAIASGTNKAPGTSCRMTENKLWELDHP